MRRVLTAALACTVLAACGDSFSPSGIAGTYNMESINGEPIPFSESITFEGVTTTLELSSGTLRINSDGTWSFSLTASVTTANTTVTETDTESGTYTLQEPATIQFTNSVGNAFTGTISGDTITLAQDGVTIVLKK